MAKVERVAKLEKVESPARADSLEKVKAADPVRVRAHVPQCPVPSTTTVAGTK
jgi:hypothetical protein